jgi:hypothetical protein
MQLLPDLDGGADRGKVKEISGGPPVELNMELVPFYAPAALAQIGRLLGQMDREANSASYGSFDRDHWAWKFRDFPLGMLQASLYPLALVWRVPFPKNPYYRSPRLLEWIADAIERTLHRQHTNGSFDAVSPNEQDAGPTLGVIHGLAEAFRLIRDELSEELRGCFCRSLRKACDFALTRSETHAFVSNHWAWFAVAFLDAHEMLGDEKYLRRAEELLDEVLRNQSPEGWYLEYEGADPGYESFGIFHLAVYWRRTGSPRLLDSLRRCVDFYAYCVHPDGSVGGVYGSRHTGLYFPAGFEILSEQIPMAAAVSRYMRQRLIRQNVLTPESSDAQNLAPAVYTWLEACLAPRRADIDLPGLPCETLDGVKQFSFSGIIVGSSARYFAVLNARKGGVCRVFDKERETLAYEDAGYLVRAGGRTYTSQIIGFGRLDSSRQGKVSVSATLAEALQKLPTPATFIILRLLNLTLFRNSRLGNLVRRVIVKRLILAKRPGPLRLQRTVEFDTDRIVFRDSLELTRSLTVKKVELPRSFTGIHMGSAKYFFLSDLRVTPSPSTGTMAGDLNRHRRSNCEFTLRFDSPANTDSSTKYVTLEVR